MVRIKTMTEEWRVERYRQTEKSKQNEQKMTRKKKIKNKYCDATTVVSIIDWLVFYNTSTRNYYYIYMKKCGRKFWGVI